jgi:hypothetical protein
MSMENEILTWSQVMPIHRCQSGIATLQGRVTSLLCNQSKEGAYADEVRGKQIFYRVTTSTNQRSVDALKRMAGTGQDVHVFEKLGVNKWKNLGLWRVSRHEPEGEGTVFLLERG